MAATVLLALLVLSLGGQCQAGRELQLRESPCPLDWNTAGAQVQRSGACLLFLKRPDVIDWFTAEEVCNQYGGHLAYATSTEEMSELKQLCRDGTKGLLNGAEGRCWLGARQQFSSATPRAGWQWTDCTAQQNAPWESVVPSAFTWGTAEPNDYNMAAKSSDGSEANRENCLKIEAGTELQDYICAGPSDYVPKAFICSPSKWCYGAPSRRQITTLVQAIGGDECICRDYDWCSKNINPCDNGGTCVNTPVPGPKGREWACSCPKGWGGQYCSEPILMNGDFEAAATTDPKRSTPNEATYYAEGEAGFVNASWYNGWKLLKGSIDVVKGMYLEAASGQQSVDLNGIGPGLMYQSFNTVPGKTYFVNFALSGNPSVPQYGSPPLKTLRVLANNKPTNDVGTYSYSLTEGGNSPTSMKYKYISFKFTATRTRTSVAFQSTTAGACGPVIDNVFISQATRKLA